MNKGFSDPADDIAYGDWLEATYDTETETIMMTWDDLGHPWDTLDEQNGHA